MAKGQARRENEQQQSQQLADIRRYTSDTSRNLSDAQERASNLFRDIVGGANTFGDSSRSGYEDFASGNAIDFDPMRQDASTYREWGQAPISAADKSRLFGNGVFSDLARTGGFSADDKYDVMNRASATGRAMYSGLSDELRRNAVSTGGFINVNPQMERLARQGAFAADEANQNARIGLAEAIRQGRLQGASGLSDAERALLSNENTRFLGGMAGASGLESNIAQLMQQGKLAGLGGLAGLDEGKLRTLMGLYGTAPGEVSMYSQNILSGLSQSQQAIAQKMAYSLSKKGFPWGKALRIAAHVVAGVATGGASVPASVAIEGAMKSGGNYTGPE